MKNSYQQNGGGIRGIAAATMAGVKGYFTAGFDFLNTLTGGRLNGIKTLWDGGMNKVKNMVTDAIGWFRESGGKIMDTFTEGIKSAVSKPVEAVKGALSKIRQMLPFSDSKEGPLSQLTLSGRKVFETLDAGMSQTADLPAETARDAFQALSGENGAALVQLMKNSNSKQVSSNQGTRQSFGFRTGNGSSKDGIVIQRLELKVSLDKIKEIPLLIKLIEEIKEKTNGNVSVETA